MFRWDDATETALTVARTSYDRDVQYPAAALAYYAFVSLLPLLVLLLVVVGDPIIERVRTVAFRFLTPKARRLVSRALTDPAGKADATLFALLVIAWSGTNVAVGFRTFVERVEGASERSGSGHLRDAVGVLGSLAAAAGSIVLAGAFLARASIALPVLVGGLVVLPVALTVVFLPLYYLPSRELPAPSAALPGALAAALGWTALLAVIRFYVLHAATYAIYGALSGVILVLTGLYTAAVVLMVGFVINATLAGETAPSG